jgi:hypothetical protein
MIDWVLRNRILRAADPSCLEEGGTTPVPWKGQGRIADDVIDRTDELAETAAFGFMDSSTEPRQSASGATRGAQRCLMA